MKGTSPPRAGHWIRTATAAALSLLGCAQHARHDAAFATVSDGESEAFRHGTAEPVRAESPAAAARGSGPVEPFGVRAQVERLEVFPRLQVEFGIDNEGQTTLDVCAVAATITGCASSERDGLSSTVSVLYQSAVRCPPGRSDCPGCPGARRQVPPGASASITVDGELDVCTGSRTSDFGGGGAVTVVVPVVYGTARNVVRIEMSFSYSSEGEVSDVAVRNLGPADCRDE